MKKLLLVLLGLALSCSGPASAGEPWGPWDEPDRSSPSRQRERGDDFHLLRRGVRFFQRFISPVDGPRCPMYPTCSAYALQALEKHGPLIGTMMTVDRLLHETDDREHRHPVRIGDRLRYADPVENNDFWFARR